MGSSVLYASVASSSKFMIINLDLDQFNLWILQDV